MCLSYNLLGNWTSDIFNLTWFYQDVTSSSYVEEDLSLIFYTSILANSGLPLAHKTGSETITVDFLLKIPVTLHA